jgi:hypothetical protein
MNWEIFLDPARPSWPGVLVAPADRHALIHVEAGHPINFAESRALAERIVAALNLPPAASIDPPART